MARSPSSRPRKGGRRPRYSPTSRPTTRASSVRQEVEAASESPPDYDSSVPTLPHESQAALESIPDAQSCTTSMATSTPSACSSTPMHPPHEPPSLAEHTWQHDPGDPAGLTSSAPTIVLATATPVSEAAQGATVASQPKKRDGITKVYLGGYQYTRCNRSSVKITYRCSFYRKPKFCSGKLVFYAASMTYDFQNMVPHTCQGEATAEQVVANDDGVCVNVVDDMKKYVDDLAEQDFSAKKIWSLAYSQFYEKSTCVVRGLSRQQVLTRVGNANARPNAFAWLETPELARVKHKDVGFLQFKYTWQDDNRIKAGKSGFDRIFGWAHPELRNLLKYEGLHLYVDGTFRCCPKDFGQFVTLMMFDPLTDLFVPVFFTLATNKTQDLYNKMFTCIKFSLGRKPKPADVVCDFEAAMIFAIREHFPPTRILGCLFHFKQACRRKMKEYRMPNDEVVVAMEFGVLDMLTVVHPAKIAIQGVAWVKAKIKARCESKGLPYSRAKWKRFWQYFAKTWQEMYPPDLWNIHGVERKVVNRTNNPLERFHRELNARMKDHPSLKRFVRVIEEIAREYVVHRASIISGDATAPVRPNMRFPRAAVLPEPSEIQDSDSKEETDFDNSSVDGVEDAELSDEELGILYDTSFDYEEEVKTDA